jgi:hypothetical protein
MVDVISGGIATLLKPTSRRREERRAVSGRSSSDYYPDPASLNAIPEPDELDDLIYRARNARSKGYYWDRGSILNVLL